MGIENLSTPCISQKMIDRMFYGVNPTEQSFLVESGDQVMIMRPALQGLKIIDPSIRINPKYDNLEWEAEFQRRVRAIKIYQKRLPGHVLDETTVIMDGVMCGADDESLNNEKFKLIARHMPKVDNVRPTTDIGLLEELLGDPGLSASMARINFGFLKMLWMDGKKPDQGSHNQVDRDRYGRLAPVVSRLTCSNVFVGEKEGSTMVFCDPDWYLDVPEGISGQINKLKTTMQLTSNVLVYSTASLYSRVRNYISGDKCQPVVVQEQRQKSKLHSV
jgi:hypothetical protein